MRASAPGVAFVLLTSGCGWSEERYYDEKTATFCDQIIACEYGVLFNYETLDDCIADQEEKSAAAEAAECEDYDGVAAKQCVEEKAALECADLFEDEAQPEACDLICANTAG